MSNRRRIFLRSWSHSPLLVPKCCRSGADETIAGVNYALRLGNLELDLDDGEVRFRVAQILDDDPLAHVVIDRMIGTTANTLDR